MNKTVFNQQLPLAIGSDHAGYEYKEAIKKVLVNAGWMVDDKGTYSTESTDYPDYAHPVAKMVEEGKATVGVLICGSGEGVCMTANKHQGVRAALCWNEEVAQLARQHNNANIICLPARFVSIADAEKMVDVFLSTAFEGGRHERRVEKIAL
ncbi:MAG: ribose 5-phosphate isomerase B [Flavipsychrobacter sp.]